MSRSPVRMLLKLVVIVAAPVGLTCALLHLAGVPWAINVRIGAVLAAFLFVAGVCASSRIQRLVEQETAGRESMAALPREPPFGLGLAAIAGLPVYKYEKLRSGGGEVDECAVCLAEVTPREVVKQLPACKHLFHERCIDEWLWSHTTCPVCRSPVHASAVPAPEEVAARVLQSV